MFEGTTIHIYLNPATGAFLGLVSLVLILVALRVAFLKGRRRLDTNEETLWRVYDRLPFGIMLQDGAGVILYQNLMFASLMESAAATDLKLLLQRRARAERPHMDAITLPVQPPRRVSVRTIPLDGGRVACVLTDVGYQKRGEAIYRALFHQLSTPIASLFLHYDLLQDTGLEAGEKDHSLQYIGRGITSLRQLLDFGRALRDPRPELVNPAVLAEEAMIDIEGLATQKSIRLNLQVETAGQRIVVDPELMRQVLVIMLDNAVQHSARNSIVRVGLSSADDAGVVFSVSDEGPGIASSDLPRIFEAGYSRQGKAGKGLGLAIARWIVEHEAHNGKIRAGNRPEGGACFSVTLPASPSVTQP